MSLLPSNILQRAHQWARFCTNKHLGATLPNTLFHMCKSGQFYPNKGLAAPSVAGPVLCLEHSLRKREKPGRELPPGWTRVKDGWPHRVVLYRRAPDFHPSSTPHASTASRVTRPSVSQACMVAALPRSQIRTHGDGGSEFDGN